MTVQYCRTLSALFSAI